MKNILFLALLLLFSCTEFREEPPTEPDNGTGAFIVNEGKFMGGDGSLSFFSYDSSTVYNDLFAAKNSRPLGDVPNSMIIYGDQGYIVVNNSGKIEVIDKTSLKSTATISGLISPRNIAVPDGSKAYVSSLYSDSIAIIDLKRNLIKGYIDVGKSTESLLVNGGVTYVTNWLDGNTVYVINNATDRIFDSIKVGTEPESMVIDKYNQLWVLCTGGWRKEHPAELYVINTGSNEVSGKFIFPAISDSPSNLRIDGPGQTLYYLNNGVWKMNIDAAALPASALIAQSGQLFYRMKINPVNGDILVTDAVDYVQSGYLLVHKDDGTFISKHKTGVLPGDICFNFTRNLNQIN